MREIHQAVTPIKRPLTRQELGWINEILTANPEWADVTISELETEAQCTCGCRSLVLKLPEHPQNPKAIDRVGPIGVIDIITKEGEAISVLLHALHGSLSILEVVGLGIDKVPEQWEEISHTLSRQ